MRQPNRSRAVSPSLLGLAGVAFCVTEVLTGAQEKPANLSTEGYTPTQAEAKQAYESVCAACHGLDARGSERLDSNWQPFGSQSRARHNDPCRGWLLRGKLACATVQDLNAVL